jgi:phage virion morphogenesis protein
VDIRPIVAKIRALQRLDLLANKIGQGLMLNLSNEFDNSTDPYGYPWHPINHRIGKPLVDTGNLRSSYRLQIASSGDTIAIEISTHCKYAAVHQFGGKKRTKRGRFTRGIQARPMLPLINFKNSTWNARAQQISRDWLQEIIR